MGPPFARDTLAKRIWVMFGKFLEELAALPDVITDMGEGDRSVACDALYERHKASFPADLRGVFYEGILEVSHGTPAEETVVVDLVYNHIVRLGRPPTWFHPDSLTWKALGLTSLGLNGPAGVGARVCLRACIAKQVSDPDE